VYFGASRLTRIWNYTKKTTLFLCALAKFFYCISVLWKIDKELPKLEN
jgi:hypothetical protein